MSNFMGQVAGTLNQGEYNVSMTENGALGYRTTGRSLLDLNFSVSSLRAADEMTIVQRFLQAFGEDKELALKWLFFARDIRGGMGERRLFRIIMDHMTKHQPEEVVHLLKYIAFYGRWDDLLSLINISPLVGKEEFVRMEITNILREQLQEDQSGMRQGKPISLLGKWMPSNNTSSKKTVALANWLSDGPLHVSRKGYRKMLTALRKHLNVIEAKMSRGLFNEIDYNSVPSKANLLYGKSFLKRDEVRRLAYLDALSKGEAKINAGAVFPHDIVHRYETQGLRSVDYALEGMWKALPNVIDPNSRTIVVADGSGSMTSQVPNGNIEILTVANALAIYFAERLTAEFKDRYITFSMRPQLVDLSGANTLAEKLSIAHRFSEVANTNIEAVFKLLLTTAVQGHMKQEEFPTNILIISDMEFDYCGGEQLDARLFELIAQAYERYNYKMPRLVFWNLNSRSMTIPVIENDLGVALVSGYSVHTAKMVMSGILDPFECLKETLLNERYDPIKAAIDTSLLSGRTF